MTENYISQDSEARKRMPMATGLFDYFPAALAAVAEHSFVGNEKHNPGQPLHWSRGNSTDHADCIARHLIDRGTMEEVYFNGRTYLVRHSAALAWRALALLQQELEDEGTAPGRGSRFPETSGHVNAMPLSYGEQRSKDWHDHTAWLRGSQWSKDELSKARGKVGVLGDDYDVEITAKGAAFIGAEKLADTWAGLVAAKRGAAAGAAMKAKKKKRATPKPARKRK